MRVGINTISNTTKIYGRTDPTSLTTPTFYKEAQLSKPKWVKMT